MIIREDLGGAINPFVVDFDNEPPEEKTKNRQSKSEDKKTKIEELVWFDSSIPEELGLPDEAASAFDGFYKKQTNNVFIFILLIIFVQFR